ncbi:MAG: hypothetical protein AAF328_02880 [Planctomycetota bacterium]
MAELADNLKAYVQELVKLQQTGQYDALMGYKPSRGLCVHLKPQDGGEGVTACDGITRQDLQKLRGAGLITVNTPRAAWSLKLRPAAYAI